MLFAAAIPGLLGYFPSGYTAKTANLSLNVNPVGEGVRRLPGKLVDDVGF
jgi:hypothetical protein